MCSRSFQENARVESAKTRRERSETDEDSGGKLDAAKHLSPQTLQYTKEKKGCNSSPFQLCSSFTEKGVTGH